MNEHQNIDLYHWSRVFSLVQNTFRDLYMNIALVIVVLLKGGG